MLREFSSPNMRSKELQNAAVIPLYCLCRTERSKSSCGTINHYPTVPVIAVCPERIIALPLPQGVPSPLATIVGFMDYRQFTDELQYAGIATVRADYYHRRWPTPNGVTYLGFYVEVVAVAPDRGEVYVACFHIGSGPDWEDWFLARLQENTMLACEMLVADLEKRGYEVRPGVVGGAGDVEVITAPTGLWKLEQDEAGLPG